MPAAFDLFYVLLAVIAVVVIAFIVRAIRLTTASIATASRHVDLTNPDVARSVADEMRERELLCPRCGNGTFALLGTGNRYQCHSCHFDFEGPAHIPASRPH
jgi:ribosomal protein S27AE